MEELASAVNAGVEVVLIVKEGSRWPNRNGDLVEVFPPPELLDALEPPECRAAFARRAITHTNEYYAAFSHNLMQAIETTLKEHRRQHGQPPEGQDNPDRLVVAQRRQLLLARSHNSDHRKQRLASAHFSEPELVTATLESAVSSPAALIDVDSLESAIDDAGPDADPRLLSAAKWKLERAQEQAGHTAMVKQEAARAGTGCEFRFLRVETLLDRSISSLPPHQNDDDLYALLYLTIAESCQHLFREKVLVVSHRWDRPEEPDPSGTQLKALKRFLRAHTQYEYVWVDYSCMPQGERTKEEQEAFNLMLGNINLLFLGASVLILLDMSYCSRFWTQFEAWTGFQEVDSDGVLRSAPEDNRRCFIECIHNANEYTKLGLIEMWSNKTPEEAYNILSRDDVSVTNQKDKEAQLPKIKTFKEHVHQTWLMASKHQSDAGISPTRTPSRKAAVEPGSCGPVSGSDHKLVGRSPSADLSPSFSPVRFEAESSGGSAILSMLETQAELNDAQAETIQHLNRQAETQAKIIKKLNQQVMRLSLGHIKGAF
uniref:Heterokaryon incompatibility domain-containing protein n=1 Tax=Haptolina ericina TaxID=156174 RepID=A0A6T8Z4W3_9EUKA